MFDNIGGKIKTLAKAQFGIGVVAFCIAGISVMSPRFMDWLIFHLWFG